MRARSPPERSARWVPITSVGSSRPCIVLLQQPPAHLTRSSSPQRPDELGVVAGQHLRDLAGACPTQLFQLLVPTVLKPRVQASRHALRPGRFATDLLLYDRFDWLSRGDRVGVSMHHLPDTVFRSKDRRHPQIDWDDILPSAKLSLGSLYPHNVGKVRSDVLRYDIEASDLALSQQRCGTLQSRSNLLPSTHGRAEGVSEGDVFLMGEHHLVGLRVPLHELLERSLIVFNYFVKIDRSHEISSCAFLFLSTAYYLDGQ